MATLNNSNIVNGNTIQPNDLLQLYDAFDYDGASTKYNVTLSGSLTGEATTATNASKLNPTLNASTNANYNVLFASTSSATYETIYKENGTVMTYNPSTDVLTVTSSFATTSSHALYADTSAAPVSIDDQQYEELGSSVANRPFKFIAGAVTLSSGNGQSSPFSVLVGKTLGVNAFITATMNTAGVTVAVTSLSGAGEIDFTSTGGSGNDVVYFTGIIAL